MSGSLALRLFQNDNQYITSFRFKKIIFFCSNFKYFVEWLAPKATYDKSSGAEVAAQKSPVPKVATAIEKLNSRTF